MIIYQNFVIILIILVYLGINLFYKNLFNIFLIIILFFVAKTYFVKNTLSALLLAYLLSIIYGILKNFHLLENFNQEFDISEDNNLVKNKKTDKTDKTDKTFKKEKLNKLGKNDINIDQESLFKLLDSNILDKFTKNLEKKRVIFIKKKININEINPILNKLDVQKINNMRNINSKERDIILNKDILISKDNFIIDGHHRWFTKKSLINNNLVYNVQVNDIIHVKMVNLNIKDFILKLIGFKRNYNKDILNSSVDNQKVQDAKKYINIIKDNIDKLDNCYNQLNNLKLL